ncbi:bifunctional lysylphosphatidylglycerol synthetase/lysine--tRNA ligase LysX [Actinocorallia lasiicapitis]
MNTVPTVVFWYVRLSGIASIVAWLSSGLIEKAAGIWALRWLTVLGWAPSLAYGLLLILLSIGIRRRKKSAWRIVTIVFALFFLLAFAAIFDPEDGGLLWVVIASVFGLVLIGLIAGRKNFNTLPDRANRRLAARVFLWFLLVTLVFGTVLVAATDQNPVGAWWTQTIYAFLQSAVGAAVTGNPIDVSVPRWVDLILDFLGGGLLLTTVWALFRPGRGDAVLSPEEELPARALLAEYGENDSLGYFALRRDKDVFVCASQRAAISYRVEGTVCLASGDPLGDPDAWDQAIGEWLAMCRAHAWIPGVMSAGARGAQAYARNGMDALELGDEAIVPTADFNLDGREMRQVRQAVRRVQRAGYTVRIRRHGQIPADELAEIVADADRWRDGATERGFSMALGRLGDPADGRCVMVEAFDRDGVRRGLLSFVPWGRNGLSLDLMRRDRAAENGINEYMVAMLATGAGAIGVQRISLNFAVLRGVFERGGKIGAGPVLRLGYMFMSFASRFWQLESLYLANAKYHPEWLPRYICFEHSRDAVRIGLAAARAEGFLPTLKKPPLTEATTPPELLAQITSVEAAVEAARAPRRRLSEQERVRHAKLDLLRAAGIDPYPLGYARTDYAADLRASYGGLPKDAATGVTAAVAGRVVASREHGRLCFATLRDETGDIQIMLTAELPDLGRWKTLIDLGDQVGVTGEVITTRTGELTVLVRSWALTAKCLHPLPAPGGLSEETRARQRYVDLIVNGPAREMVRTRGAAVAAVRDTLRERGYLEVETPMLQPVHGGATARPFTTRMNAYNLELYLRIAPELYLKRLLVGGIGRVFELNRNFRNEGVSPRHNPEFTMLEAYEPYGTYDTMAVLTRELTIAAALAALGTTVIDRPGASFDLAAPWAAITVYGSVSEALGTEITPDTPLPELRAHAEAAGLEPDPDWGQGRLVQELFELLVEQTLIAPTFVRDFPAETSPLTRPHRDDPRLAEKWDLIVCGIELGTAYSELIDPVLQRRRLTEQSLLAAGGDPEAMDLDEDFLRALEYAMPPSGGLGMGVDRLLIMLTGKTIRETIPFPLVRPG